ncbi:MAG: NF038143 family protein [Syntrophobacteraceae bacterium]
MIVPTRAELERKKQLILEHETIFANQIGSAVFEKPRVNLWMILLPILFLHLIYRMQKYKEGRMKFNEDFMITRRRAMNAAVEAAAGGRHDIEGITRQADLAEPLAAPYESWVGALVEYYMDLLAADGESFESLVRAAFGSSSNYLLSLNRLSMAERKFYSALKPRMAETEGATAIISTIEERSHQLRRELADKIFASKSRESGLD